MDYKIFKKYKDRERVFGALDGAKYGILCAKPAIDM